MHSFPIDRTRFVLFATALASSTATLACPSERPAEAPTAPAPSTAASAEPTESKGASCADIDTMVTAMLPCTEGSAMATDPRRACRRFAKSFRPGVAKVAIQCLESLSHSQVCGYDRCSAYNCGVMALARQPRDPSTEPLCAPVRKACGDDAYADCAYLSGLVEAARATIAQCLREKCDIHACLGYAEYSSTCVE